jgi:glutamate--cysteine ligase
VRLGSLLPEIDKPTPVDLATARRCSSNPLRNGQRLGLADFDPCAILLNNDL